MRPLLKLVVLPVILVLLTLAESYGNFNFGGEIPWPLANQREVTESNSVGMWKLYYKNEVKTFNVEMIENQNGFDWIRVSELHPETYEVISWGEGFFLRCDKNPVGAYCKMKQGGGTSSYSNIFLSNLGSGKDRYGRYIEMYPNGSFEKSSYLLRLVEVQTSIGNVLGLSIINHTEKNLFHYLGVRHLDAPLNCTESLDNFETLSCFR